MSCLTVLIARAGSLKLAHKCVAAVLIVWLSLLSGCAGIVRPNFSQDLTELREGDYNLDPEHAYIHFKIGHLDLSKIVGRFNVVSGTLDFNPGAITDLKLQGIIEADSIDLNNPDLESTMQESDWLHADAFPQITFSSTSVSQLADGSLEIKGDLTIRDVTQEIILLTQFNGGADNILTGKYTLGFSASTAIKRSAFGIDDFAALVGDDIEIEMHGEFQRNAN